MKVKPAALLLLFVCVFAVFDTVRAQTAPDAGRRLSDAQAQQIKSIRSRSELKAAPLALRLASTAKRIYENMLADTEDEALRRRLSKEMDEVAVGLLAIKGQSIRDMVRVLTPEQRRLVRAEMLKTGTPGDLSELIVKLFNVPEK